MEKELSRFKKLYDLKTNNNYKNEMPFNNNDLKLKLVDSYYYNVLQDKYNKLGEHLSKYDSEHNQEKTTSPLKKHTWEFKRLTLDTLLASVLLMFIFGYKNILNISPNELLILKSTIVIMLLVGITIDYFIYKKLYSIYLDSYFYKTISSYNVFTDIESNELFTDSEKKELISFYTKYKEFKDNTDFEYLTMKNKVILNIESNNTTSKYKKGINFKNKFIYIQEQDSVVFLKNKLVVLKKGDIVLSDFKGKYSCVLNITEQKNISHEISSAGKFLYNEKIHISNNHLLEAINKDKVKVLNKEDGKILSILNKK